MSVVTVQQALDLAFRHFQSGKLSEAASICRQVLAVEPENANALHFHGFLEHNAGQLESARDLMERSIAHSPGIADWQNNLGNVLQDLGEIEAAVAAYQGALELRPEFADAHHNMGGALWRLGRRPEAVALFRKALELRPEYAVACNSLGNALREEGNVEEAIGFYRRALEIDPHYAEAYCNLGAALGAEGRMQEAADTFRCALRLKPDLLAAYNQLGGIFAQDDRLDEALASYRYALQRKPDSTEVLANIAAILFKQGEIEDAMRAMQRAVELDEWDPTLRSQLVAMAQYHPGYGVRELRRECLKWNLNSRRKVKESGCAFRNTADPNRRLKVGFVSADLREHVVARNLSPLFRYLDRGGFQIICYSNTEKEDAMSAKFRGCSEGWRGISRLTDTDAEALIREDRIDILVDLGLHTVGNRLPLFARRPAPVQVSFAGYPGDAGLDAIEHHISDRFLEGTRVKADARGCLIDSFWCYEEPEFDLDVGPLPAAENGWITFGCLHSFRKTNDYVADLWAGVLNAVPTSRFIVLSPAGNARRQFLRRLEKRGVEAKRVEFVEASFRRPYFETYQRIDIALDTFPYNGHTSSLDAFWMGVPVVSMAGQTAVSRAGFSQSANLGLAEFVADSAVEYVRIATGLSQDISRLSQLRSSLRQRMRSSVLMDAPRFAGQIGESLRALWRLWCGSRQKEGV